MDSGGFIPYFKVIILFASIFVGTLYAAPVNIDTSQTFDPSWPKQLTNKGSSYIIYQPQVDAWDGYRFKAHAAIAVNFAGDENPIYGQLFLLSARLLVILRKCRGVLWKTKQKRKRC